YLRHAVPPVLLPEVRVQPGASGRSRRGTRRAGDHSLAVGTVALGQAERRTQHLLSLVLGEVADRDHAVDDVLEPGPRVRRVVDRVVHARGVHHAGQHRALDDGQVLRRVAEVTAARLLKAVKAVPVVGDLGVHVEYLLLGVRQVELDGE